MRHLLQLRFAALLMLISFNYFADAQIAYQGLLEGIYPTRLVIDESTPKATLSISTLDNRIRFLGGCSADACKYRGIDTSLAIVFESLQNQISGRIQYGDGTSKSLVLNRIQEDVPFANACESDFWLRVWTDAANKHQLTLATLPGKQVKGTLYLAELGTSVSVSGIRSSTALDLTIVGTNENSIGTLQTNEQQPMESSVVATLDLEGSKTQIVFELTGEEQLNCLQSDGRYDLIYPTLEGSKYESLPAQLWKDMASQGADYGHAWFEPTLFNTHIISGWIHWEGPNEQSSKAINLMRNKGNKLKQGTLLGGKRTRSQLLSVQKERAVAQHPLRADVAFQSWVDALDFSTYTLTTEGLALASERHPIFGQLQSIIPWRELPKTESLPNWLTQSK